MFGMFGMLTLLFTTTTLIPLLMLSVPCAQSRVHDEHSWEHRVGGFLSGLLAGPGKWVPIGLVAVILVVSGHYTRITEGTVEDPMPGVEKGIGGFLDATEATREVALDNWLAGPLLTAAAVFVIAALIFRSLLVSGILMVMLLITLFAQYGLGGYLTSVQNWSSNLAFHVQVALSIAMGLGIDYGIW